MTVFAKPAYGYAAASFDLNLSWPNDRYLELQITPMGFRLYLRCRFDNRQRLRVEYTGDEAATMGRAVCAEECHPVILADWCDEHTPDDCDFGFVPATWLRAVL